MRSRLNCGEVNNSWCRAIRAKRGHPVGFGRMHHPALTVLGNDEGAREVIARATGIRWIDIDDPGVLRDVDVPADLGLGIHENAYVGWVERNTHLPIRDEGTGVAMTCAFVGRHLDLPPSRERQSKVASR